MNLRALLFTADGSSSATLCQVLTELGIAAEICSELLVAVERIGRENYDALIVDWDAEAEATVLLKAAREQKSSSLNLALVPDDTAIGRALQQGANSVIKKPIDLGQAHDTLSTARDLILSRRTEQRDKHARIAALQAEAEAETDVLEEAPAETQSTPKPGFLEQTSTRSAFEAEEKVGKVETPLSNPGWQAARGPASLREENPDETKKPEPVTQKRWDEVKTIFREAPEDENSDPAEFVPENQHSQDATGVFSSLPENAFTTPESETSALPQYLVFAMVGCVLVAGVLYVWAPGDSYLGRVSSAVHAFSAKAKPEAPQAGPRGPVVQPVAAEKTTAPATSAKAEETTSLDPTPVESTDVDPNKIQIIETKVIPKAGAQQPPTTVPPPDSDQAKALAQEQAQPQPSVSAPAPDAAAPPQLPSEAPAQPPAVRPEPAKPALEAVPAPADARVGVVIPDSLRTTPAPSPASSLEPLSVPEETSLTLLVHKVDPEYPAQALSQHLEGPVVLQAWVAKDGSVRDVKLVKGYFALGRAAFDAVKQWRFKPLSQNGRVIEFQTTVTLNFKYPN